MREETTTPHIAIIGAGASGMMAAIAACRQGARVTLIERQDRVGRKIPATGNGRCNLTNVAATASAYHGADPGFVTSVLGQLPFGAVKEFFSSLGLLTVVEEGRVYPLTGQATTVLDVLRYEIDRLGVDVRLTADVQEIESRGRGFTVRWRGGEVGVDRVIVAAGGKAAPQLGGTDSGIALLRRLGHSVTPVYPALVPLKTESPFSKHLKGVKVQARAALHVDAQLVRSDEGEVLFTDYGLSGIPIMQLSGAANRALSERKSVVVMLDLFPAWTSEDLVAHLQGRFSTRTGSPVEIVLTGLVHKRLIPVVLREAGIVDIHVTAGRVSSREIAALGAMLKGWTFEITGSLSWNEAQIMAGGVDTREFDPLTLESRKVKGLFAAGEVLDVAGDCGGFNLQWAWASGFVAGRSAAGGGRERTSSPSTSTSTSSV